MTGHSDMVLALAFTPTGASLASGGLDSTIKLWDVKTGRERSPLAGQTDGVPALAFAPGARRMASAGYDGTVKVWEAAAPTLSAAAILDYPGEARGVSFGTAGKALYVTGSADALTAYDPIAGLIDQGTPGSGASLVVTPDGQRLAIGGVDGKVRLLDAATRREVATFEGHSGEVRALAIGLGGTVLASGGVDGRALIRDLAPGSLLELPACPARSTTSAARRTVGPWPSSPRGDRARSTCSMSAPGEPRGSLAGPGAGGRLARVLARRPDDRDGRAGRHDRPVRRLDALRAIDLELPGGPVGRLRPRRPVPGHRAFERRGRALGRRLGPQAGDLEGPLRPGLRRRLRSRRQDGRVVGTRQERPALEPGRPQDHAPGEPERRAGLHRPGGHLPRRQDPGRGRGRLRLARPHRPLGHRQPPGPGHAPRP